MTIPLCCGFCYADGAALVYTSAKDGVNCNLLHRYLLSCVYPGAFSSNEEGQVRTKEKKREEKRRERNSQVSQRITSRAGVFDRLIV